MYDKTHYKKKKKKKLILCASDYVQGTGDTSVKKIDTNSCPWGAYIYLEKTDDNEDNKLCVRR